MSFLLFNLFESPTIIILVLAVIVLLFGGSKLPQLAKALGQSKRAFKEGIDTPDEDERRDRETPRLAGNESRAAIASISDEELFEEARRRAQEMKR
jgi:sec-independent protein translocase protein TatA